MNIQTNLNGYFLESKGFKSNSRTLYLNYSLIGNYDPDHSIIELDYTLKEFKEYFKIFRNFTESEIIEVFNDAFNEFYNEINQNYTVKFENEEI